MSAVKWYYVTALTICSQQFWKKKYILVFYKKSKKCLKWCWEKIILFGDIPASKWTNRIDLFIGATWTNVGTPYHRHIYFHGVFSEIPTDNRLNVFTLLPFLRAVVSLDAFRLLLICIQTRPVGNLRTLSTCMFTSEKMSWVQMHSLSWLVSVSNLWVI